MGIMVSCFMLHSYTFSNVKTYSILSPRIPVEQENCVKLNPEYLKNTYFLIEEEPQTEYPSITLLNPDQGSNERVRARAVYPSVFKVHR